MTKESKIETDLRVDVEAAGGVCIKLPAILYRGIPDRLVLLPGAVIVFVELKKDKARTQRSTKVHQTRWKKLLVALGFNHFQLEGMDGLETFRKDYL